MENPYGGSVQFVGAEGAARLGLAAMLRQYEAGSFSGHDLSGVGLKSTEEGFIAQNNENSRKRESKTVKW